MCTPACSICILPRGELVCLCLKRGKGPLAGRDGRAASAVLLNRATKSSVLDENLLASNVGISGSERGGRRLGLD